MCDACMCTSFIIVLAKTFLRYTYLAVVTTAALGNPVVPEVYIYNNTSGMKIVKVNT